MSRATVTAAESELLRGAEIQRLFELCRERHPDEWHTVLRKEGKGRELDAFEVLTLLVAAQQVALRESTRGE